MMSDYKITDGSILQIPAGTKGCGKVISFADVSNQANNLQTLAFNRNAPNYRIAARGLNIEGYCKNKTCAAYDKLVIDTSHALGCFDLVVDEHSCKCPLCSEVISLETCAFTGCQWKYTVGIQQSEQGPKKVEQLAWTTASPDKYDRFDGVGTGRVQHGLGC